MANTVLIVENDAALAQSLCDYLALNQWEATVAGSAENGMALIDALRPDVVLTDQSLPGGSGLAVIRHALAVDPEIKVIMMTAESSVQAAVDAMKAGAFDYLSKPISLIELKMLLDKAVDRARMEKTLSVMQRRDGRGSGIDSIIGDSLPMRALKENVRRVLEAERVVADGDLPPVLIVGERGTGKELLARAIHFDGSRRSAAFVEISCASLPSNLLEAELFGHERGALADAKDRKIGLVEAADGGTLFLDEIGEVDLAIQAKLLKLLENKSVRRIGSVRERKVNIRIVAASNQDLAAMVRQSRFRSDLFARLSEITLTTPPLRSCGSDILRIANHYLRIHAKRYGKRDLRFSADAEQVLLRYPWPGNVREMRNVLEQGVLFAHDGEVSAAQLSISSKPAQAGSAGQSPDRAQLPVIEPQLVAASAGSVDTERELVVRALERTDWNVSKSAKLLGLSREMLRYRIEKYGLARPDE